MINFGAIFQVGYLTNDIQTSMQSWLKQTGTGPFTWYRNVSLDATSNEKKSVVTMDVAIAFRGDIQIELIQQTNDAPSPYRVFFEQGRVGLHHLAFISRDIDADIAKAREQGFEITCTINAVTGRYAYFHDPATPENIFELLAVDARLEKFWQQSLQEAKCWNGADPIRVIDLKSI